MSTTSLGTRTKRTNQEILTEPSGPPPLQEPRTGERQNGREGTKPVSACGAKAHGRPNLPAEELSCCRSPEVALLRRRSAKGRHQRPCSSSGRRTTMETPTGVQGVMTGRLARTAPPARLRLSLELKVVPLSGYVHFRLVRTNFGGGPRAGCRGGGRCRLTRTGTEAEEMIG